MADYVPIPFVPQPIDQTSQRMKLADLLYQANLARMQADQQRQLGIAQMVAQLGQQIGGGLEGWMNLQQQERNYALRERQAALQMAREEERQRQFDLREQRLMQQNADTLKRMELESAERGRRDIAENIGKLPGGAPVSANLIRAAGAYGLPFVEEEPTIQGARPATMSMLAGITPQAPAMEEAPALEGFMPTATEAVSPTAITAYQRRMSPDEMQRKAFLETLLPEQRRMVEASRLFPQASAEMLGAPPKTPTIAELRAKAATEWLAAHPGSTMADYDAMIAGREEQARVARRPLSKPEPGTTVFGTPIREGQDAWGPLSKFSDVTRRAGAASLRGSNVNEAKMLEAQYGTLPDENTAKTQIYSNLVRGMPTETERNKALSYGATIQVMENWDRLLGRIASLSKSGKISDQDKSGLSSVEKGLASGGFTSAALENVANTFRTSSNEDLAALAAEMTAFLQEYRQARTGLAFTAAETEEYRKIIPMAGDAPLLNRAKAQGLLRYAKGQHSRFWNSVIGDGGANWATGVERYLSRPAVSTRSGATNPYTKK